MGWLPGTAIRVTRPQLASSTGLNFAPRAPRSAMVASRSSHTRETSYWPVPDVGWTPISLGPVLKISQPPPVSTWGSWSTSLRNARAASGSSAMIMAWTAVITAPSYAVDAGAATGRSESGGRLEPGADREPDRLGASAGAELDHRPADVGPHRVGTDHELIGDLGVRHPTRHPRHDLALTLGQVGDPRVGLGRWRSRAEVLDHPTSHRRC